MFNRFGIAKHWLAGRRHNVDVKDLLRVVFSPSSKVLAKRLIKSIHQDGTHYVVRLSGQQYPVYWPLRAPLCNLYECIREIFYPEDWHFYEKSPTIVRPDDTVLDCGAGEGLFTLSIAHRCRKVYAIEPLPTFVDTLTKTLAPYPNVELIPVGLFKHDGTAYITDQDTWSEINFISGEHQVTLTTIDKLFFERGVRVDYIKADLEGSEVEMLEGAIKTIREYRPRIAITTYHRVSDEERIVHTLQSLAPEYQIHVTGIKPDNGASIILHAWC